jgi:hypothetical protein
MQEDNVTHHRVIYVFFKGFVWTTAGNLFACEFEETKASCTTRHQVDKLHPLAHQSERRYCWQNHFSVSSTTSVSCTVCKLQSLCEIRFLSRDAKWSCRLQTDGYGRLSGTDWTGRHIARHGSLFLSTKAIFPKAQTDSSNYIFH